MHSLSILQPKIVAVSVEEKTCALGDAEGSDAIMHKEDSKKEGRMRLGKKLELGTGLQPLPLELRCRALRIKAMWKRFSCASKRG